MEFLIKPARRPLSDTVGEMEPGGPSVNLPPNLWELKAASTTSLPP